MIRLRQIAKKDKYDFGYDDYGFHSNHNLYQLISVISSFSLSVS